MLLIGVLAILVNVHVDVLQVLQIFVVVVVALCVIVTVAAVSVALPVVFGILPSVEPALVLLVGKA